MCATWTPRVITGHLVSFVDVGLPSFFANMARHRFDYDSAADTLARRVAERPMDDLLQTIRDKAGKKSALPIFPPEMTGLDVAVHTQDVRRSLDLSGSLSDESVVSGLGFLTQHRFAKQVVDTEAYEGLALDATDVGWSHGEGPAVSGTGEAIMMAMAGRPTLGELSGEGVDEWRERQGA
jgi:uncharacterized protein (TIGR03083 family)